MLELPGDFLQAVGGDAGVSLYGETRLQDNARKPLGRGTGILSYFPMRNVIVAGEIQVSARRQTRCPTSEAILTVRTPNNHHVVNLSEPLKQSVFDWC